MARQRQIVMSVPWSWAFNPAPARADIRLYRRPVDWSLGRVGTVLVSARAAVRLALLVRSGDHVVISTMGPLAAVHAAAACLRRPASIHVLDFLHSPRRRAPGLGWLLRNTVDGFIVIRHSDIDMLESVYRIPSDRTTFIRWPVHVPQTADIADGDYLYAAGWAHRDWETLIEALSRTNIPAVLAGVPSDRNLGLPASTRVIDMPPPDEGRALAAHARVVAVLLKDTHYAAGPLVLLDALAMAKAVIANDVNGNRDYVVHGETAWVVPPGDSTALATALNRLWTDSELRERLGQAARADAVTRSSPTKFWAELAATVGHHPGGTMRRFGLPGSRQHDELLEERVVEDEGRDPLGCST